MMRLFEEIDMMTDFELKKVAKFLLVISLIYSFGFLILFILGLLLFL